MFEGKLDGETLGIVVGLSDGDELGSAEGSPDG